MASELIFDTDMGYDDILAMTLFLPRPELSKGLQVIVTHGIASSAIAKDLADALVSYFDRDDAHVILGETKPLQDGHRFPEAWISEADKLSRALISSIGHRLSEDSQSSLPLNPQASQRYLCCAPLTSLSTLRKRQTSPRGVTIMGGVLDGSGNIQHRDTTAPSTAEWNFHADPRAAAIVLIEHEPVTLITLDVQAKLNPSLIASLGASRRTKAGEIALVVLKFLSQHKHGDRPVFLWDVIATAIALNLIRYDTRREKICIAQEGELEPGTCVRSPEGAEATVVTSIDLEELESLLLKAWVA